MLYRAFTCFCLFVFTFIISDLRSDECEKNATLYYQHASNAVLINNAKGQYILTLVGVESKTLFFEGGLKVSDQIATEKFYDKWVGYGFRKDPPIVSIIRVEKNKSLSFKLKDPEYNMLKKAIHFVVEPQEEIEVNLIGSNWGEVILLFERDVAKSVCCVIP